MHYLIGVITVLIVGSAAFLAYKAHQKKSETLNAGRRQLDLAIAQLSLEVRHHPKNAAAFCKRGIILQRKGDLPGALADLEHALALDPNLTEAHYHHAAALEEKGDLAGAEREFDSIVITGNDPYYGTATKDRLAQLRAKKKSG